MLLSISTRTGSTRKELYCFQCELSTSEDYQCNFELCAPAEYRWNANRKLVSEGNVSAVRLVPGVGLVLLLAAVCAGQSLGDAARQTRH